MVNQAEEDDTTIPEDTSSQDATTAASSATPEPKTFITLSAWGGNHFGELGNGTTTDSSTPVQVSDLVGVRDAAGGNKHSLALKDDGTLWAWGWNHLGKLGNGTDTDSSTPVQVTDPNDPSGYLSGIQSIAARDLHSMTLKDDGTVWAWGFNRAGQLGDGTTTDSSTPVQVTDSNDPSGYLSGVQAIAAGSFHSLALKNDGTVWAWGGNFAGQLGNGTTTDSSTPVQVGNLDRVKAIAAGWYYSLALKNDGTVWAWGSNTSGQARLISGQLGRDEITDSSTPIEVGGLPGGVELIAAGGYHSLALKDDGTVWAWGLNIVGLLGNGTTTHHSSTPVQVSEVGGIEVIVAGSSHSLALKDDGTVWAWGANGSGQLGTGTTTKSSSTPVQVSEVGGVKAIAVGLSHSLAVQ
jgi:alpha-tubulin suppressor-like RCC1 family protein